MKAVAFAILVGSILPLAGCENKNAPPPPANQPAVETHTPNVDVKADKGNVEVKAPGVDVEIQRDKSK